MNARESIEQWRIVTSGPSVTDGCIVPLSIGELRALLDIVDGVERVARAVYQFGGMHDQRSALDLIVGSYESLTEETRDWIEGGDA